VNVSADGLRHKTSGLCEKTNSIFYLLLTAVELIWIRCPTEPNWTISSPDVTPEVLFRESMSRGVIYTEISEVLPI